MKRLEMSPEEVALMREMLERAVHNLEMEVRHTDHRAYKDLLTQRMANLSALLARLVDEPGYALACPVVV